MWLAKEYLGYMRSMASITRSRSTFAITEAAAIAGTRSSPLITGFCGTDRPGIAMLPSTSTSDGETDSLSTERLMHQSEA